MITVSAYDIIVILFAHWVGDYLFQFNIIANRKATSIAWLVFHVAIYTTFLLAASAILFEWPMAWRFALLNGLFHLVTDFVTSRLGARNKHNPRMFYLIMGFDQFIHGATLIATLYHVI